MPTTPVPQVLTDPGYLFWAPLGTADPTNTVAGSKFTDTWPVAWIPLGATDEGSTLSYSITVEPVTAAEFFDALKFVTTERASSLQFNLVDFTLASLKRALNGGSLTVVSGTGATQLNKYSPPDPGTEVRAMLGWESLDNTVRLIARQTINSGEVAIPFVKAPAKAIVPCTFNFEKPSSTAPFDFFTAGTARA